MKRLHTYILKSFAGPFLFTLSISVFVLVMAAVWRYVDEIAGRDLPVSVILEFFGYYAVTTLYMAIPLAILLASIMTFGNMGERYELIAIKSAGISLLQILKPLFFVVILLSALTFYISNYVAPVSLFKSKSLLSDIIDKNPEFLLKEGTFVSDMPGATIKVERLSKEDDGKFYDAIIYIKTPSGRILKTITAKSGRMVSSKDLRFMTIWLYDGKIYEEETFNVQRPFTRTIFEEYMFVTPMKTSDLKRTEKEVNKQDYRMLTYQQLDTLIAEIRVKKEEERMLTTKQLENERLLRKSRNDSTILTVKVIPANIDSIFKTFSSMDRNTVLSVAIGSARSTKKYLQSKKEYFTVLQTYTAKAEGYWHQKFSWPFACIIFFLIGSSLGAIVRKGGFGMPVLISIILFIAYYMADRYGLNFFVVKDYLPAYIGCWLATVLFLSLGVWLTYKAIKDSALMDADIYRRVVVKLLGSKYARQLRKFIPFLRKNT